MPTLFALSAAPWLLAAVATDLRARRIPNALSASLALAALVAHAATDGWAGVSAALGGGAVMLLAFLPGWLARRMGAGDVKLAAALGVLAGWPVAGTAGLLALLGLAASVLVAGGVLALGWLLAFGARTRMPYALAIAAGWAGWCLIHAT